MTLNLKSYVQLCVLIQILSPEKYRIGLHVLKNLSSQFQRSVQTLTNSFLKTCLPSKPSVITHSPHLHNSILPVLIDALSQLIYLDGPNYIHLAICFEQQMTTPYNLRGMFNKLSQLNYNNMCRHNSFVFIKSHMCSNYL